MHLLANRLASFRDLDCLQKKKAKRRSAIVQKKPNKFWMFLDLDTKK